MVKKTRLTDIENKLLVTSEERERGREERRGNKGVGDQAVSTIIYFIFLYILYFIHNSWYRLIPYSHIAPPPSFSPLVTTSLNFYSTTYYLDTLGQFTSLFFFNFIYLFIYLWLCWVFVSVRGLSLVAASGGHSSSRCVGLSLSRSLLLQSTGSRHAGSVIVAHGPSCSMAYGILPDQGSNPCPLHWQADSQPLRHQGSPTSLLICFYFYFYKGNNVQCDCEGFKWQM